MPLRGFSCDLICRMESRNERRKHAAP
uniref:Uncharacterized protein n=1 Tax=Anguilla anguilla TaxID=7936 RepID=A0A0E9UBX2_ANGAN